METDLGECEDEPAASSPCETFSYTTTKRRTFCKISRRVPFAKAGSQPQIAQLFQNRNLMLLQKFSRVQWMSNCGLSEA